jgi:hypothetical protein
VPTWQKGGEIFIWPGFKNMKMNIVSKEEMKIITRALVAISRRDADDLESLERFVPYSGSDFWDCVNGFGRQEFLEPNPIDIGNYEYFRKADNSGVIVDAFLYVKDPGYNEFKSMTVSFEVNRKSNPSVIYGGPATW